MKGISLPAGFRRMDKRDEPFIYNSWLRTFRKESAFGSEIPHDIYFRNQKAIIDDLLATSNVLVLCNPEVPDQIYGYAVYAIENDMLILHFIYLKLCYRGMGFAERMLSVMESERLSGEGLPIIATHATHAFHKHSKEWNATYNPYLIGRFTRV